MKHEFDAVIKQGHGGGAFVEVPFDVKEAFGMARPHRKEHLRAIEAAKRPETRERRIAGLLDRFGALSVALLVVLLHAAEGRGQTPTPQTLTPVATVTGLSGPEAVRYDPDQDVYFVANFNGRGDALDNNGFISRVRPDGTMENLHFIMGGSNGVTLHAPRGMYIVGDTLWVADADAVRGFHRRTGAAVATVDFTALQPGFLNDVAAGPGGELYVTDTPRHRIYRIEGRTPRIALEDSTLHRPNGITWDAQHNRFVVVPYGGRQLFFAWRAEQPTLEVIATPPGGRFDGVEVLSGGRILFASQADSSVHAVLGGQAQRVTRTSGAPADIGVDTRRKRVAVPYIALNRVEIFQLPSDW